MLVPSIRLRSANFGRASRFTGMAFWLAAAGCGTTIRQEDYFRLSAGYSLVSPKWPGNDPRNARIGRETFHFDFKPAGVIGVPGVVALRDEVVERVNGFAAGYEWGHKSDGPQATPDLGGRSQAWQEGFGAGAHVASAERRAAPGPET